VDARRCRGLVAALILCAAAAADAATTVFFNGAQVATAVSSGVTSDTISCEGYLFTYTRDKLFTGGVGLPDPIGRPVRVPWPAGVEAQAVTVPPPGVTDYKARLTIRRVDGAVFDLTAFTFRLLANTAGAGGALEIMPKLAGEDGFADPLYFNASGNAGNSFSYDETPGYGGSTALLKGFDTYSIGLYVDFAFTALTLQDASVEPAPLPPVMTGALSRKVHAGAGTHDLALDLSPSNPTTEPRTGGAGGDHVIAFVFDKPVADGVAAIASGTATAGTPTFAGTEMVVALTGVADSQYVTVDVSGVTAADGGTGGSGSVRVGFLVGDVNGSRTVTLSDLLAVNSVLAQSVTTSNFTRDVNAGGTLTLADLLLINSRLAQGLPAP
jgi:hypothetical protein